MDHIGYLHPYLFAKKIDHTALEVVLQAMIIPMYMHKKKLSLDTIENS